MFPLPSSFGRWLTSFPKVPLLLPPHNPRTLPLISPLVNRDMKSPSIMNGLIESLPEKQDLETIPSYSASRVEVM